MTRDISLSEEELHFLDLLPASHVANSTHSSSVKAIFRGKKLRTKFSFSCKMYDQEIKEWIEEEEADVRLNQMSSAARRRAFSCKL